MNKKQNLNLTESFKAAIADFAAVIERDQRARYETDYPLRNGSAADYQSLLNRACSVQVHYGKSWVRVDVGDSGKYMVDAEGNIVGIKGYGVPHPGHRYGTLGTTADWNWGGYTARRIVLNVG